MSSVKSQSGSAVCDTGVDSAKWQRTGGGLDPQEQVCEAFKERLLLLRSLTLGHLSLSRVIFRTVENGAKQGGTWGAEAFYRYSKCHPVDPPH